ncbi:hypothetical protein GE21DRAFT_1042720 [Neurospora crassa]|nr:hypothetical protein GE21DRAFT_1007397 [Neurospora crassa]KHE87434.1 hypothetical protein GE21DRAFT_1042720 [Neurospora crassa]
MKFHQAQSIAQGNPQPKAVHPHRGDAAFMSPPALESGNPSRSKGQGHRNLLPDISWVLNHNGHLSYFLYYGA